MEQSILRGGESIGGPAAAPSHHEKKDVANPLVADVPQLVGVSSPCDPNTLPTLGNEVYDTRKNGRNYGSHCGHGEGNSMDALPPTESPLVQPQGGVEGSLGKQTPTTGSTSPSPTPPVQAVLAYEGKAAAANTPGPTQPGAGMATTFQGGEPGLAGDSLGKDLVGRSDGGPGARGATAQGSRAGFAAGGRIPVTRVVTAVPGMELGISVGESKLAMADGE
ncbi:unnamed protein product, partial [Discosporangium mesarthrocarpum]